jgi:sulfur relay (sulfurtransferase) DsrC/TusE family protein
MKVLYGMSKGIGFKKTVVEWDEDVLAKKARELAEKEAEKKEWKVFRFVGENGFKKLFFNRWLVLFCDMKNFNPSTPPQPGKGEEV